MANVGMVGLDWQERVNWDRLRKYRLERAREEGQVPRSRELSTAAILLAGSVALFAFGKVLGAVVIAIAIVLGAEVNQRRRERKLT